MTITKDSSLSTAAFTPPSSLAGSVSATGGLTAHGATTLGLTVEREQPSQFGSGVTAPAPRKRAAWTLGGRHTPRQPTLGEILDYLAQPGIALVTYKSGAAVVFRPNGHMVYGDDAPAAVRAAMQADGVSPYTPTPNAPEVRK